MPAAVVLSPLNQVLRDPTSQEYRSAVAAVEGSDTVHDAVLATGVLEQFEDQVVTEARAVLGVIPPAIDDVILAALGSAFGRELPVTLTWIEDPEIAVRVWEQPQDGGVVVHIVFMSPHGQTFV